MIEVVPAIIAKDFTDLEQSLSAVKGHVDTVQIDVCDGKFVPSKSWPIQNDSDGYQFEFEKIISEGSPMPFWEDFNFEIDLMVKNPHEVTEDWIRAGANALIFHVESGDVVEKLIEDLRVRFPKDDPLSIKLGIALNPSTANEKIAACAESADFIQCMGNDRLGFHGVGLDPQLFEKIALLRKAYPAHIISVDIGVTLETAPLLVAAGANKLVSGSTIFESESISQTINLLQNLDAKRR